MDGHVPQYARQKVMRSAEKASPVPLANSGISKSHQAESLAYTLAMLVSLTASSPEGGPQFVGRARDGCGLQWTYSPGLLSYCPK
jgi:hypothetical protein